MKILVTSQGDDLSSPVDPRFGRAKYFVLVDSDSGSFTAHDNTQNLNAMQGAGIQAAQNAIELGAEAILTGNVGPKAYATLQAGNVAIFTGASGTVQEAIDNYRAGKFQAAGKANVEGHWT